MAYVVRVGEVEIISLLDVGDWKLDAFFPSVPDDEWERYRALYPEALCAGRAICTSATAYAVRAGGSIILVDTGLGPGPHEGVGGQAGQLLVELRSEGISPVDVNTVVFTHLHRDHVGWNGLASGREVRAVFPNARYLVPKKDWEYYSPPEMRDRTFYLDGTRALYDQGLVDLVDGERSLGSHLALFPTPGHTPGHQAVLVASQGERAAILGDLAHTPPQVEETGWLSRAEVDPELSCITRRRVFDRLEAEHTLLCAGHFPHPGFGYLVRSGGRRMFQAATLPASRG